MKKVAIILLSLLLVVVCFVAVACDEECTGEHQWGEWKETTPATCTKEGQAVRTCIKCGEQETQVVEASGHKILDATGSLKSCRGFDLSQPVQCSACDEMISGQDLVDALDHKMIWKLEAVAPTCTETGLSEGQKCLNCNSVFVEQQVVPALGHDIIDAQEVAATCTEPNYTAGTICSRCGEYFSGHEPFGDPLGHDFSNSVYFEYTECVRGCGIYSRRSGGNPFETEFIFDFDSDKQEEIDIVYNTLVATLEGTNSEITTFDQFVELFNQYDEYVGYIQAQYQFARILNDINYSEDSRNTFSNVSEYYNTTISRYYKLFKQINESKYKDEFWAETKWDDEYIAYVLGLADSYDLDNRNAVDEIIEAYEDLLASIKSEMTQDQRNQLFSLYSQLVEANNNIATTAGFANYMEYAYEKVYERDYTPEDTAQMREYVKEYIGPIIADVANAYVAWNDAYSSRGGWSNHESQLYYSQFSGAWMWRDIDQYANDAERSGMIVNSLQSIADYFKFLDGQDKSVKFYDAASNLFEKGNIFMGRNKNITAYTWYVYSEKTPILVFGGSEDYRDAFTFIHEFGHYYQFVHNKLLSVPMDHDETQSQGDEMMFLAWLREHMPEGVDEGFEILELEQLVNMLGSIVLSTAVDEFEYLVYTGATEFDGKAIEKVNIGEGVEVIDYAKLYETILKSYWANIGSFFNTQYWMYVTFDNAAYYISYAMSALPCLELYAIAGNDGLDTARDSYIKLFTFSSNDEFIATDSFGDTYVKESYEKILNWAGLKGPFQEELYEAIQEYFESRA